MWKRILVLLTISGAATLMAQEPPAEEPRAIEDRPAGVHTMLQPGGPTLSPAVVQPEVTCSSVPLQCPQTTDCINTGDCPLPYTHYAFDNTGLTNGHPHTEDIANNVVTVSSTSCAGTNNYCALSTVCPDLTPLGYGNINTGGLSNVLVRAWVQVSAATAPSGALFLLGLFYQNADGTGSITQIDATNRRLHTDTLQQPTPQPYGERIFGLVPTLPAGRYRFFVAAKVLGTGSITFNQEYLTASGMPVSAAYPAIKDTISGQISVANANVRVTNAVSFAVGSATPLNMTVQGHVNIASAPAGAILTFCFSVDGGVCAHTSSVAIPTSPSFPTDFNILDYLYSDQLSAGTHTLAMWAHTDHTIATVMQWRQLEALSFPSIGTATQFSRSVTLTPTSCSPLTGGLVSSDGKCNGVVEMQPGATILNDGHGKWHRLIDYTIPPVSGSRNWQLEGYVQLAAHLNRGLPVGDIAYEIVIGSFDVDGGYLALYVSPIASDGVYHFGDGVLIGGGYGATVRLWVRKSTDNNGDALCPQEPCSFQVSKAYMGIRETPADGCLFR